jgi:hypothetical protein
MDCMKTQGFRQGIYETSSTQKEALGALRITNDGRKYRYCKATAVAIIPGVSLQPALQTANHINRSAVATAIGLMQVTFAVGATAVTADQYKDGYLSVNAGTAGTIGTQYRIKSHTEVAAAGGNITVQLADPLATALVVTTDKLSLTPNPYNGCAIGDAAHGSVGVTPVAIPASSYFWSQTGGVSCAWVVNATAEGSCLIPAASGLLKLWVVDYLQPQVGYALAAGVTSNAKPVYLTID